jgi:TRAP-type mannitol/chloroaromatic compound transport system permease small subunit
VDSINTGNNSSKDNAERRGDSMVSSPLPKLEGWLGIIDRMSEYSGRFLGWFVVIITILYCTEVFLRSVFNAPTIWVHESSIYFFAAYFALGGAYALKNGKMVNVDIWVSKLSPRTRGIVDGVMSLVAIMFLVVLLYQGGQLAYASVLKNETSQTPWAPPIYPLKILAVLGTAMLFLQVIARTIRDFAIGFKGGGQS